MRTDRVGDGAGRGCDERRVDLAVAVRGGAENEGQVSADHGVAADVIGGVRSPEDIQDLPQVFRVAGYRQCVGFGFVGPGDVGRHRGDEGIGQSTQVAEESEQFVGRRRLRGVVDDLQKLPFDRVVGLVVLEEQGRQGNALTGEQSGVVEGGLRGARRPGVFAGAEQLAEPSDDRPDARAERFAYRGPIGIRRRKRGDDESIGRVLREGRVRQLRHRIADGAQHPVHRHRPVFRTRPPASSDSARAAALAPHMPCTPAPGGVDAEQR